MNGLDRRLAAAYRGALSRPDADQPGLQAAQRGWAERRDDCDQAGDVHRCVLESYQTRLVKLMIDDPATVAPPVVSYHCPSNAKQLTAQSYNQSHPPSAVLTWGGDQEIVFVELSGSGARYGRQGIEYWEHQREVTVDFYSNQFVCTTS